MSDAQSPRAQRHGMPAQAVFNQIVIWILSSPFHGILSGNLMLITYTGRKSGVQRQVPITYLQDGKIVTAFCDSDVNWWKNFRGGAGVTVRLRGHDYPGTATPVNDDPDAILPTFAAFLRKNRQASGFNAVPFDANGEPNREALIQAIKTKVMVHIELM